MKSAEDVAERVEEYRYHSTPEPGIRDLSLRVLFVRLKIFHRVVNKINKAKQKAAREAKQKSKSKKRRRH